jgi:hypothetical protein
MKALRGGEDMFIVNLDEAALERLMARRQGDAVVCRPMRAAAGRVYKGSARRGPEGHMSLSSCAKAVPELPTVSPQCSFTDKLRCPMQR